MTTWWVLAASIGVVLAVVAIVVRSARASYRPSRGGGLGLRECFRRGSLAEVPPTLLLEAMQEARATGRLRVRGESQPSITMYFLSGHLFHAVCDGAVGDEVVRRALGRSEGYFDFDPNVRLPEEESVTTPLRGLFARSGGSQRITDVSLERPAERQPQAVAVAGRSLRRGSLAEIPLRSLLVALAQERASGK